MKTIEKTSILSVSLLALFLMGMMPGVAAFSSTSAAAASNASTSKIGTCPSQAFLSTSNVPSGSAKILRIHWTVKNDEDSGFDGYWALDHYSSTLTVWYVRSTNSYYGIQTFSGVFVSPEGAVSPGSTTNPGNIESESIFGTLTGGIVFTFTGAFLGGPQGNLGTMNYGGTVSDVLLGYYSNGQKGDSSAYNPILAYFSGGTTTNPAEPHWGFAYELNPIFHESNSLNQWCNYNTADGGSSGDIYVP
jgi:hypothetical protein